MYGNSATSVQHVRKWCQLFLEGRENVDDEYRVGRPRSVSTTSLSIKINKLIRADHHTNVSWIAKQVNTSVSTVHNTVRKELKYRKVCAHWIPHSLSEQQKTARLQISPICLAHYRKEGNAFLDRIITGDETWCHQFIPLSKLVFPDDLLKSVQTL